MKLIIALLILAHLISDFMLRSTSVQPTKSSWLNLSKHWMYRFFLDLLLVFPYWSWYLVIIIFFLTIGHQIIHMIQMKYQHQNPELGLETFLVGESLHLLIIIAIAPLLQSLPFHGISTLFGKCLIHWYPLLGKATVRQWYLIIIVVAGYIFSLKAGTIIVQKTLQKFDFIKKPENSDSMSFSGTESIRHRWSIGAAIGILERFLIVTLVLLKNYALIGLVLTGKSLVRFKEFADQEFTEYYLIGTLTSILVAVVVGIILNMLIHLENAGNIFQWIA